MWDTAPGKVALFHGNADNDNFVEKAGVLFKDDFHFAGRRNFYFSGIISHIGYPENVARFGGQGEVTVDVGGHASALAFYNN